jgi:hypothetical protein
MTCWPWQRGMGKRAKVERGCLLTGHEKKRLKPSEFFFIIHLLTRMAHAKRRSNGFEKRTERKEGKASGQMDR